MKRLLLLTFALTLAALPAAAQDDAPPGDAASIEQAAAGEHRAPLSRMDALAQANKRHERDEHPLPPRFLDCLLSSGHCAFITQQGAGNVAEIDQQGANHLARIIQRGNLNETYIFQSGILNTAIVEFEGDRNTLLLGQSGIGNLYFLDLVDSGRDLGIIEQTGVETMIVQIGRAREAFDVRSRGMDVIIRHH